MRSPQVQGRTGREGIHVGVRTDRLYHGEARGFGVEYHGCSEAGPGDSGESREQWVDGNCSQRQEALRRLVLVEYERIWE